MFLREREREEMGAWDLLYSATDKLKQNVPALTPVTNACQSSYRASCTIASNVYKAVTVDGAEKVKDYLPDSQTQEKIKRIAKEVAVPELLRFTRIRGSVFFFFFFYYTYHSSHSSHTFNPLRVSLVIK